MATGIDLPMHGTAAWYALNAAHDNGFTSTVSDGWSSDALLIDSKLPEDCEMVWEDSRPTYGGHDVVFNHGGRAIIAICQDRRDMRCSVYAKTVDEAGKWMVKLREALPPAERKEKLLDVTFWYSTANGPRSYDRQLKAPAWADIEVNYPQATRERLESLQRVELTEGSGKLVLWQGEPGTGKTFALRALGEEWASWCRIHYVLDPERFFAEGDYLLTVILGGDNQPPAVQGQPQAAQEQWRLIVLEDAGEMLARDAKMQVGQGLARLLNLCDGLLGQGLRVLVLITTNEHVGTLHQAVSRPGRCLSQIEFERFGTIEANQWLKSHDAPELAVAKQSSLADLYSLLQGNQSAPAKVVGFGK